MSQGSILGPFFYLIYIKDILNNVTDIIYIFADDTSLDITVVSLDNASNFPNHKMAKISLWADEWLVLFNPKKNESILLSRNINKPIHPPLIMNIVTNVESHLGITFESSRRLLWLSI